MISQQNCKTNEPHHRLMVSMRCGKLWFQTPVGSKQRLYNWYLLLLR